MGLIQQQLYTGLEPARAAAGAPSVEKLRRLSGAGSVQRQWSCDRVCRGTTAGRERPPCRAIPKCAQQDEHGEGSRLHWPPPRHPNNSPSLPDRAAMAEADDGLLLNLALPEAPAPHLSRTQQRKQKWTQQRAAKVGLQQRGRKSMACQGRPPLASGAPGRCRKGASMPCTYASSETATTASTTAAAAAAATTSAHPSSSSPRTLHLPLPAEASSQARPRRAGAARAAQLAGRRAAAAAAGRRGAARRRRRRAAERLLPRGRRPRAACSCARGQAPAAGAAAAAAAKGWRRRALCVWL